MPRNKAYRDQWVQAGYRHDCASAEVTPPPSSDDRRVFHFCSAEHAISNIAFRRIKVARISDLNDPFELLAANSKDERVREAVNDFKDAYGEENGFLCFSGDWLDPVLWSHYSDRHRGICLGFDLKRSLEEKVEYICDRIQIDPVPVGSKFTISADLQKQLLRSKFENWRYEDEYRVSVELKNARSLGSLYFCPFGPELRLKTVTLGMRCEHALEDVRALTEALHPDVAVLRARPAEKWFRVVPDTDLGW